MHLNLNWRWYAWSELDADTLYAVLRLRSAAFVVEQRCAYADMDGLDPQAAHLCVRDPLGAVIATLRLLPPGVKSAEAVLGRLVVTPEARGQGVARAALREGVRVCQTRHPGHAIRLSGQQHLEGFYASAGFAVASSPYVDDGIWHVDMVLR